MIVAPAFLCLPCEAYLVGNHGDGKINALSKDGKYLATLKDSGGNDIIIDNLWGLCVIQTVAYSNSIFFTAGISGGTAGYVGRLDKDDCYCICRN